MKIFIWMNYPSHHQSYFFKTLVDQGVNLQVGYYSKMTEDRRNLGWNVTELESYELFFGSINLSEFLNRYKDYIHIVPGYGSIFTRKLIISLCRKEIQWVHWSERSTPGVAGYKSYIVKKLYANLVNKYALGALSQGVLAEIDFRNWGIRNNIGHLSYSIEPLRFIEPLEQLTKFKGKRKSFLYLGRMIDLKGVDLLIKAFNLIESEDWCLILVGEGSQEKKLKTLIEKIGLDTNKISFFPSVNSEIVNSVICAADVFILPSRYDGWGVVLNEAASLAKPLIASDMVGAAWHLIDHGKNGYRFKSNNFYDLYLKLKEYVDYPEKIIEHGLFSEKQFDLYSSDAMAYSLIKYLDIWCENEIND